MERLTDTTNGTGITQKIKSQHENVLKLSKFSFINTASVKLSTPLIHCLNMRPEDEGGNENLVQKWHPDLDPEEFEPHNEADYLIGYLRICLLRSQLLHFLQETALDDGKSRLGEDPQHFRVQIGQCVHILYVTLMRRTKPNNQRQEFMEHRH